MRRFGTAIVVGLIALGLSTPVGAADLHTPHEGTSCGDGQVGTWHFVNVQTAGSAAGTITAVFDGGDAVIVQTSDQVNRNMQHFRVTGVGEQLDTASTNLPGRLVLSDFSCEGEPKKK